LGEVEAIRGSAEVKLFGYSDEVAEMAELNVAIIHISNIIMRTNKILDVWLGSA
jgi:hypothetical protein